MDALVENERTAVFLLLSALIGFLKEEGRMDEQNFPMVMELLNHAKGTKENDEKDLWICFWMKKLVISEGIITMTINDTS